MGLWIMAGVTFREAARRKILWTAVAAGSAFLALFATGMPRTAAPRRAFRAARCPRCSDTSCSRR